VTQQKPVFDSSKKEIAKATLTRKQSLAVGRVDNHTPTPAPEAESETEYSDSEDDQ